MRRTNDGGQWVAIVAAAATDLAMEHNWQCDDANGNCHSTRHQTPLLCSHCRPMMRMREGERGTTFNRINWWAQINSIHADSIIVISPIGERHSQYDSFAVSARVALPPSQRNSTN